MERREKHLALRVTLLLLAGVCLLLWRTGFFQAVGTAEGIQAYIERFSPYSQLVFFLIQFCSVVLAPIPSNLSALAGAMLFGMWQAFLLTIAAVFLGSVTVFLLARSLGQSFAERFVGKRVSAKYQELFRTKRDTFLALALLLPFFPDDLLCILAGLTDIPLGRYLVIVAMTRPWGLLVASALGGSVVDIPLPAMAAIGAVALLVFLTGMRYGDRLEGKILEHIKRRKP